MSLWSRMQRQLEDLSRKLVLDENRAPEKPYARPDPNLGA